MDRVRAATDAMRRRGPDADGLRFVSGGWTLGHRRLAVLGLGGRSDQPFVGPGESVLTYNGEMWNHAEMRAALAAEGAEFRTAGDTEVLSVALERWGVAETLERIEWMGAFGWASNGAIYVARDRFGEVPLHVSKDGTAFASERKALLAAGVEAELSDLPPGTWRKLPEGTPTAYYVAPIAPAEKLENVPALLRERVLRACRERAIAEVPVCTLLSGGIDSAAIALGLRELVADLVAYTAVMDEKSADLKRAREVARFLGIELREVRVAVPTADDLRRVVELIEMPHKAQVEIGWACVALARRMREDGFKVTFSGEGSDELWASYGFSFHALKTEDWHEYRKRLVLDQARKNFARCNKVFLDSSIECRLPFLNRELVEFALSLPRDAVQAKGRPKAVLQEAFRGFLPDSVVDRPKVAFQDGMGLKDAVAERLPSARSFYKKAFDDAYGRKVTESGRLFA